MRARAMTGTVLACLVAGLVVASGGEGVAATRTTHRVSVGTGGQADGGSKTARRSVSSDGRFVVFQSDATNLVPNDTNAATDIFVRDRSLHTTSRVSTGSSGQSDGDSDVPSISGNGRFVVFHSVATNLVPDDTNAVFDIFVRDRSRHTTSRVSTGSLGQSDGPSYDASISFNGRYVAFESSATNLVAGDTNGFFDIFVRDRSLHTTSRVSNGSSGQSNGPSNAATVSGDGRLVTFQSDATNLVAGDTNGETDVFVRNRSQHRTFMVSTGALGESDGPSFLATVSGDGRFVAFYSYGTNLVAGDTNGVPDVFVRGPYA